MIIKQKNKLKVIIAFYIWYICLNEYVHANSIKIADACILDGDVLQHPTIPVVNETNMKKKATMKSAIIARDISRI